MNVDFGLLALIGSCIILALLVYLMYRSAMREEWRELSKKEKRKWQKPPAK